MSERDFGRRARAALRRAGCLVYPVETGSTAVGFPDLVVVHEGGASFVELKCRPGMMLSRIAESPVEGKGQKSFASGFSKRSAFRLQGVTVSFNSFLLAECMDGVALLVGETGGKHLAACWEGLPAGEDLRDAMRAWRVYAMPSGEMEDESVGACFNECAARYACIVGVLPPLARTADWDEPLKDSGGKERALQIAREICDMARHFLLIGSMEKDAHRMRAAPVEGGGYVLLSNGG